MVQRNSIIWLYPSYNSYRKLHTKGNPLVVFTADVSKGRRAAHDQGEAPHRPADSPTFTQGVLTNEEISVFQNVNVRSVRARRARAPRSAEAVSGNPRGSDRAGHPLPLNRRRHPDIVVAGLHDDERGGERTQVNPGELGGDRSLPAGSGPHVTRPGVAVDHRVPVQQTGQQDGPGLTGMTWAHSRGERGADDREHGGPG